IILGIIENEGKITTAQIQRKCGVGYGTAKNDLDLLAEKGLVQRTHGGAIAVRNIGFTPDIRHLSPKERCEKIDETYLAIAKKAVSMIEKDDVVYFTHASIGYLMAREMPDIPCTVVVNSITIAEELRLKKNIRVFVTGGEMNENGSFYDEFTMMFLRRMRFDLAFITAAACTASFGLSIQTPRSIGLTNLICENARRTAALFPSAKIGKDSVLQLMPPEKIDVLITDSEASDEECAAMTEKGVQVVRVHPENSNPGEETT
ncbi:MAG: DeoR/GlpR transcriptional regulator, partial [Clostridia bacterium]|nr:DeoR/GlpR transcriptional regulator [Clostridia bacterium]